MTLTNNRTLNPITFIHSFGLICLSRLQSDWVEHLLYSLLHHLYRHWAYLIAPLTLPLPVAWHTEGSTYIRITKYADRRRRSRKCWAIAFCPVQPRLSGGFIQPCIIPTNLWPLTWSRCRCRSPLTTTPRVHQPPRERDRSIFLQTRPVQYRSRCQAPRSRSALVNIPSQNRRDSWQTMKNYGSKGFYDLDYTRSASTFLEGLRFVSNRIERDWAILIGSYIIRGGSCLFAPVWFVGWQSNISNWLSDTWLWVL